MLYINYGSDWRCFPRKSKQFVSYCWINIRGQRKSSKNFVQGTKSTKFHRRKMIKKQHQTILEAGSCKAACCLRTPSVHRLAVINHYVENPRQSLIRGAICIDISVYLFDLLWKLLEWNITSKFAKSVLFSGQVVFYLDVGIIIHKVSHLSVNDDPQWLIEILFNSTNTMIRLL